MRSAVLFGERKRSIAARATAETTKVRWITVCQSIVSEEVLAALMKVCRRWIEEMPTIAIASFTLSTLALTWESHSGWSGWFLRLIRETKVS